MMQYRIMAQFFTVTALVAGVTIFGATYEDEEHQKWINCILSLFSNFLMISLFLFAFISYHHRLELSFRDLRFFFGVFQKMCFQIFWSPGFPSSHLFQFFPVAELYCTLLSLSTSTSHFLNKFIKIHVLEAMLEKFTITHFLIFLLGFALVIWNSDSGSKQTEIHVDGEFDPKWKHVADMFRLEIFKKCSQKLKVCEVLLPIFEILPFSRKTPAPGLDPTNRC